MITKIREWWIFHWGSIDAKAALWVARSERGLSVEEEADLNKWLSADLRHEDAYFEIQVIWQGMDVLSGDAVDVSSQDPEVVREISWIYWMSGLAAAMVLGLAIWAVDLRNSDDRPQTTTYVLEASGYKRHVLEDGSTLELKPGTRLTVSYTPSERRVFLEAGESFFSVEGNPDRPFVVESKLGIVTAIGTAFSVKLAGDFSEVWVVEGKVKIAKSKNLNVVNNFAPMETEVVAGQMIIQDTTSGSYNSTVVSISPEELEVQLEWKDRILQFVSAPLYEIVAEFNRLNDVKIILLNDEMKTKRLTIAMEPDNYQDFTRMLELTLDANVQFENKVIFISSEK